MVRQARADGLVVAGLLTEGAGPGQTAGRRVTDLRSGESRHFGSRPVDGAGRGLVFRQAPSPDPLTPGWKYDAGVFEWGNEVLARATPCDLLVVDELGPLEVLGGRGWVDAFDVLAGRRFGAALVVCRPGLLEQLEARLGARAGMTCEVTTDSRDELPAIILREVSSAGR